MKTALFDAIKKSPQDITNLVSGKEGDDVYVRSLQDSDIDTLPIVYTTNKQKILSASSGSIVDL
jgi:hypothetical protein